MTFAWRGILVKPDEGGHRVRKTERSLVGYDVTPIGREGRDEAQIGQSLPRATNRIARMSLMTNDGSSWKKRLRRWLSVVHMGWFVNTNVRCRWDRFQWWRYVGAQGHGWPSSRTVYLERPDEQWVITGSLDEERRNLRRTGERRLYRQQPYGWS